MFQRSVLDECLFIGIVAQRLGCFIQVSFQISSEICELIVCAFIVPQGKNSCLASYDEVNHFSAHANPSFILHYNLRIWEENRTNLSLKEDLSSTQMSGHRRESVIQRIIPLSKLTFLRDGAGTGKGARLLTQGLGCMWLRQHLIQICPDSFESVSQFIYPLTVQFCSEDHVAWQQPIMNDAFAIPSNGNHNHQRVEACPWLRLSLLILVNPVSTALGWVLRYVFSSDRSSHIAYRHIFLSSYCCACTRTLGPCTLYILYVPPPYVAGESVAPIREAIHCVNL